MCNHSNAEKGPPDERHDRAASRLLGDPAQLGDLEEHYESQGHRVLAPAYPGFEVEVEALNADPTPVEAVTIPAILSTSSR